MTAPFHVIERLKKTLAWRVALHMALGYDAGASSNTFLAMRKHSNACGAPQ